MEQAAHWRHSLVTKFMVGVLCALVPTMALSGWLWLDRRERDREVALASLTQVAEAIAIIVDHALDDTRALVRATADDAEVRSGDAARMALALEQHRRGNAFMAGMLVFGSRGQLVAQSAGATAPTALAGGLPEQIRAMSDDRRRTTLLSLRDATARDGLVVVVLVAMTNDDGSTDGHVAGIVDLDAINHHLGRIRLLNGQALALIDATGRVVRFVEGAAMRSEALTWDERDRSRLPGVQAALRGELVVARSLRSDLTGDERLAVFAPALESGWVIGASWPVSAALAPGHEHEQRELAIFGAVLAVLLVWAVVMARSIVQPLRRLAEHAVRGDDGTFAEVRGSSTADEIGLLARALDSMRAEVRRTVGALQEERTMLEAVIAQLPVGIVVVSAATKQIQWINALAAGYQPRPQGEGPRYDPQGSFGTYHLDGRPCLPEERPIARVLGDGQPVYGVEVILRRPDEPDCQLHINTGPVRDRHGNLLAVVQTFEDVTTQRQQEARLRERDELLRALFEQFPASLTVLDHENRVVMFGGRRFLLPEIAADDITGQPFTSVLTTEEYESLRPMVDRALSGETVVGESRIRDFTVRAAITPLRDADGVIDRVLFVAFDITEERAQVERAQRDEKLHALGQMAGGIAHDLNQALTLVSGYGELAIEALDRQPIDVPMLREMVETMGRAAYDGGQTVRRLLTFSRGETNDLVEHVDIAETLREVERLTLPRWQGAAQESGTRLSVQVMASPGLRVSASASSLREAFTNLVMNALDAMPHGGTVTMSAREEEGRVVVEVADTGAGMSADVRKRMFEPFFTTKGARGTGLGMSMVFGIVERHGGQIDVMSEIGQGTTIQVTLPLAALPAASEPPPAEDLVPSRLRILVVDDDEQLTRLSANMLRREGHEVETATSAEAALERLTVAPFDLVVSDVSMGDGMTGWQLAEAIQRLSRSAPVVLATGWGAAISQEQARAAGVLAVLAKPYRRSDFRALITEITRGATADDRQGVPPAAS